MHRLAVATVMALVVVGCSKKEAAPPPPPASPPSVGQELSKVPGISIKRSEAAASHGNQWKRGEGFKSERSSLYESCVFCCPTPYRLAQVQPDAVPEGVYDIRIPAASSQEDAWTRLADALQKSFPVSIAHETRQLDVYVLTCPHNAAGVAVAPPSLVPTKAKAAENISGKGETWTLKNFTMKDLANLLTNHLQEFVIDETGLNGAYDFSMAGYWGPTPDKAVASMKRLGLDLKKEHRPVEAWYVESVPSTDGCRLTIPAARRRNLFISHPPAAII